MVETVQQEVPAGIDPGVLAWLSQGVAKPKTQTLIDVPGLLPGNPLGLTPASTSARALPQLALSSEQQHLLDVVATGADVLVDATVGAGKTTAIQQLCDRFGRDRNTLYLTYSRLLKQDAQARVDYAYVQNFHGVVYPALQRAGLGDCNVSESIQRFNEHFAELAPTFPVYELLVVDEYQDMTEDYALLLRNLKSLNPGMQSVFVGDMAQKVRADTRLDVSAFITEFCNNPVQIPFTQSFRMGPEMGELLSEAWNKPVVGVNTSQRVSFMDFNEAVELLGQSDPSEVLCLGTRNGPLADALNAVEGLWPEKYNKNTTYASIRDGDEPGNYGGGAAVFTTFDSSKGLERSTCILFGYDEGLWDARNKHAGADPVVLRNVFLVAASRGKDHVVFVSPPGRNKPMQRSIGWIPVRRFAKLPAQQPPVYAQPQMASACFDFKYAENVQDCFELLERTRLDNDTAAPIIIERSEGLIDLSPVIGHFQEALYFEGYNPSIEAKASTSKVALALRDELTDDLWKNALILAAVSTEQMRYASQVTSEVPQAAQEALTERLSSLLPSDCEIQEKFVHEGFAVGPDGATPITFSGVVDAIHDGKLFELKFVTELSPVMFLQLGLYLVMSGMEHGVLWNTRTDERWEVKVPDKDAFMDAVVTCVSKQFHFSFTAVNPCTLPEADWDTDMEDEPHW